MRAATFAGTGPDVVQRPSTLRFTVTLLIFVTALCVFVPFDPLFPEMGLDPSWRLGLDEAIARGFLFGSQTIFTFGPYAPLYTIEYHPALATLMLGASVWLASSYAACLRAITPRNAVLLPIVVCLAIASLDGPRDVLLLSCPMLVTVATFARLRASPARDDARGLWLMAFLYSALGLLPLIKGTFVVACIGSIAIAFVFALRQKRRALAAIVILSPAVTALVAWTAAGQPPQQIFAYLLSTVTTVSSYTEAMAFDGDPRDILCFLVAAPFLLLAILVHRQTRVALRVFLVVAFGVYLFVAFKGAFVRQDVGHSPLGPRPLLLGSLFVMLVFRSIPLYLSALVAAAFWFAIDHRQDTSFPAGLPARIATPYRDALSGLSKTLRDPRWPKDAFDRAMADIDRAYPFPRLAGPTDIYSYGQANLIAAGNDWSPRPVFQSYAAYDARLMALNALHLQGPGAPTNVIFSIEPIDGRFPPLEDGASWSPLLSGYRATGMQDGLLLLVKNAQSGATADAAATTSLHAMGESVALPSSDDLVYLRLAIRPSLFGVVSGVLFKIEVPTIEVTLDDGRHRGYRLLPRMAASEFLMSPLVENTDDFARLFGVFDDLRPKRVVSFSIRPPQSRAAYWQDQYEVTTVVRPASPPPAPAARLHHVAAPSADRVASERLEPGRCDGTIETWSAKTIAPRRYAASGSLDLGGWLAAPTNGGQADDTYAVLTDRDGRRTFAPLRHRMRTDIVHAMKRPTLVRSGFQGTVDLTGLSGPYTVGFASKSDDRWTLCDTFDRELEISAR